MTSNLRIPESVRSIVVLEPDASGRMVSATVYEVERKKKKTSPILRPLEKSIRQFTKGGEIAASNYLDRHLRSREKKRDGWLRDMGYNLYKANEKGLKKMGTLDSVFRFVS